MTLRDSNTSKSQLTMNELAHELNNVLVGVSGNARLLLDEGLPEKAKTLVQQILECSSKASELTKGVIADQPLLAKRAKSVERGFTSKIDTQGRKTVLVIDDEEIVRSVSTAILVRAGFKVITADSGLEGLRIFERKKSEILCVLLDLTMPYMRGNLVFAKLKACDPEVKVFLMSGYSREVALAEFDSVGIQGFISKPFQTEDVISAVNSCVGSVRAMVA